MIEALKYILLGIVQGVCEVIPVSSSAHLIICEKIIGISSDDLFLEMFLHVASLIAILIYERKLVFSLAKGFFLYLFGKKEEKENFMMVIYLFISTIPLVLFTVFFESVIYYISSSLLLIGLCLVINGIFLNICNRVKTKRDKINCKDAVTIGLFQCLGAMPGISRSGSCLCGAFIRGIDRSKASDFAFLMFIPVMLGVIFKTFMSFNNINMDVSKIPLLFISFIASSYFTFWSLGVLKKVIDNGKVVIFSYYTFILGLILIVWNI